MGSTKSKTPTSDESVSMVIKIAVIGTYAVGKSSIVKRYIHGDFDPNYTYTRGGHAKNKTVRVHGSPVRIQLIDTGGQSLQRKCIRPLYKSVHGIILVHDISKPESYSDIDKWLAEINTNCLGKPVVMLIGNKSDLDSGNINLIDLKGRRYQPDINNTCPKFDRISCDDIYKKVWQDSNLVNFYCEVSAKTGYNIESMFEIMVKEVIHKLNESIQEIWCNGQAYQNRTDTEDPIQHLVTDTKNACVIL